MQDSNAVSTPAGAGAFGVGSRREPGTDRTTTTTRVSNSAGATPSHPPRPSSFVPSSLLHLSYAPVYGPVLRKRLRSEDSRQPFFLLPRH
jgi:hypothetical protein